MDARVERVFPVDDLEALREDDEDGKVDKAGTECASIPD